MWGGPTPSQCSRSPCGASYLPAPRWTSNPRPSDHCVEASGGHF